MNTPKISIICALSENRIIGKGDRIPWRLRADLLRFKNKTLYHTVIMGRATFESVREYYRRSGRPVPERKHVVVTRDGSYNPGIDGSHVAGSIDEALRIAREIEKDEVFVSGGEQIFRQTIGLADKLYLTIVKGEFKGDKYFPDYSVFTKTVFREVGEENGQVFTFLDLERA